MIQKIVGGFNIYAILKSPFAFKFKITSWFIFYIQGLARKNKLARIDLMDCIYI